MHSRLRVEHVLADPRSVAEAVQFYRSVRGHGSQDRFHWLYLDNPAGKAHLFFLRTPSGDVRGMSNAIPMEIRLGTQSYTAWNTVDFALDPRCRTLGPALKLRRALFEAAGQAGVAMVYYYPAAQFRALHERAGADGIWSNVQLRIPLHRSDFASTVARRAGVLRPVAHAVLACTSWMCKPPADRGLDADACEWSELRPALARLTERVARGKLTFGCSWEWLMWRFRDCPVYRCRPFLVAERNGFAALGVVATVGQASWLKLLWPPPACPTTLDALSGALRRTGTLADDGLLRAVVVEGHWLARACASRRVFHTRDDSITVVRRTNKAAESLPKPTEWDRLIADRDL